MNNSLLLRNSKRNFLLSILLSFLLPSIILSQNYRQFATQENWQRLRQEHPEMLAAQQQIERNLKYKHLPAFTAEITIPIVFHVLYQNQEEFITAEQVLNQLTILNQLFDSQSISIKHQADTLEGFALLQAKNLNINFCLGLPENATGTEISAASAINYIPTLVEEWTNDDAIKQSSLGGVAPWDTKQYLNIWVANLDSIAGYATMPGTLPELDGIVIDYNFFGTNNQENEKYKEGKTLIHLLGSYLGLFELAGRYPCADDYVSDTPVHNARNYGCPGYKHISTCFGYGTEMTMNYMDFADDACMYLFTQGQGTRMVKMIQEARSELIENKSTLCEFELRTEATAEDRKNNSPSKDFTSETIKVFPNPAKEELNIVWQQPAHKVAKILIYDTSGRLRYQQIKPLTAKLEKQKINTSSWLAGIYFLHIQTDREFEVFKVSIVPKD